MSHLSKIKTRITDKKILEKTLNDLGFTYQDINKNSQHLFVNDKSMNSFEFNWDGEKYSILADVQLWQNNIQIESLIDKITQQYSYNSIIKTSIKEGFNKINKDFLQDGSIKLTIQRWSP